MNKKIVKTISIIVLSAIAFSIGGCSRTYIPGGEAVSEITEVESITEDFAGIDISMVAELITEVESTTEETTTKAETTTKVKIVETTTEAEPELIYYEPEEEEEYYANDGDIPGDYAGTFELTAYEWTGQPMANGQYPYYGACASNYFALGTVLYIEGYGTFTVCDRGGMPNNVIDIYLGDPDECWEFGRKYNVAVYYA